MAIENGNIPTQYGANTAPSGYDPNDRVGNWFKSIFDSDYQNEVQGYNDALNRQYNAEQSLLEYERNSAEAQKDRDFQSAEAQKDRDFNASEAEKTRLHNEHLRDTAYQSAVADMQKAGINPILAFSQGGADSPASSPASHSSGYGSRGSSGSARMSSGQYGSSNVLKTILTGVTMVMAGLVMKGGSPYHRSKIGFGK
ncbi:DNA pilot protein [Dipodfec virus UOA04_Rod_708]|nr:DNA pilot protein [Dipodfec virus UOA04_Rod_708]